MRYRAAAFDYDGTLAHMGQVEPATIEALQKLRQSGRKLVLVTGRMLSDIMTVFPQYSLFHRIVTENGAVLCRDPEQLRAGNGAPGNIHESEYLLTQPADRLLVEELAERGVQPLSVGRCIIATYVEYTNLVSQVILELGLDYAIIFNKEHAMALPMGVNKGSGLQSAMAELNLPCESAIAFGDAENDEALFGASGFGVAVQNAVPSLKVMANFVSSFGHGPGVVEAIDRLMADEFEPVRG
jgi:HAD superfamily hydrolase (TIGR01484 family)